MIKPRNGLCPNCNKTYLKKRSDQKFCSTECRVEQNNKVLKEKYKSIKTLKRTQKQSDKEYQGKEKELLEEIKKLKSEIEILEYQRLSFPQIHHVKEPVPKNVKIEGFKYVEIENNIENPYYIIYKGFMYELWDCRMFKKT